jgi:periplasmic protein TonB
MSYANRRQMSSNRTVAIIFVALLHVLLGYALISGLAYNVIKKAAEDLKTFDVEDEPPPPPEEPPPPPEEVPQTEPPPVAPPPLVRTNVAPPPPIQSVDTAPPRIVNPIPAPPAIAPPPPPPPPPVRVQPAKARANLASYVSDDDYPANAIRDEQQGTTRFTLSVGPDGRVSNCSVTSTSGSSALDQATCRIMKSRARFTPATDSTGAKTSDSVSGAIKWVLPND